MSTFNTTYNFNQRQMNLGEGILCGAFGTLTGCSSFGGGFGGYGMGMMSPFGMGGSIFSMMGMGCGFGGYGMGFGMSDSQFVGSMAGMIGSQMILGGINQAIQNKQAKTTISDEIKSVEDDAKTHLDVLGSGYTLGSIKLSSVTIEEKYEQDITKAKSNRKDALKAEIGTEPDKKDTTAHEAWETKKQEIEAKIERIDNETATDEELGEEVTKAIKAKKDRQKAIDDAKIALKELKEKYEELKAKEKNETMLNAINKVDGNNLSRTRESKLKTKINEDGTLKENEKYDGNDVQGALAAFKKSKTEQNKKYWYRILHNMYKDSNLMSNINSDIKNIVKKYFKADEYHE